MACMESRSHLNVQVCVMRIAKKTKCMTSIVNEVFIVTTEIGNSLGSLGTFRRSRSFGAFLWRELRSDLQGRDISTRRGRRPGKRSCRPRPADKDTRYSSKSSLMDDNVRLVR